MRSRWIEHRGRRIFYQDFSNLLYNADAVLEELALVQQVVRAEPLDSVLVLSDFRETHIGSKVLKPMDEASVATKSHVHKAAVLGITGMKRTLADMLTAITGQPLRYFNNEEDAKNWLAKD